MPWAVTNYTSMLVERVDIWYNIAIETMDKLMYTWITLYCGILYITKYK